MSKTIFCDIDGVIFHQPENFISVYQEDRLFGRFFIESRAKLMEWYCQGHTIILTTGRPQHEYEDLLNYLKFNGIYFHKLIMNCGSGKRVLINDIDPVSPNEDKAIAINLVRNQTLRDVKL